MLHDTPSGVFVLYTIHIHIRGIMAKAIGSVRATDYNIKGHTLRSSSGRGSTFTPAAGLGKAMVDDLDSVLARAKLQYARDRRAAARDRVGAEYSHLACRF